MIASRTLTVSSSLLLLTASACAAVPTPPSGRPAAAPVASMQPEMTPTERSVLATDVPDATTTDPDKYHVVMENERVRVLRYHDVPGTRTSQHRHPECVLYALSSFQRRLHFPDGTSRNREFHAGDVMWIPAQTHIGENTGETDTEVLLLELKTSDAGVRGVGVGL